MNCSLSSIRYWDMIIKDTGGLQVTAILWAQGASNTKLYAQKTLGIVIFKTFPQVGSAGLIV